MARKLLSDSLNVSDMATRIVSLYKNADEWMVNEGRHWYPTVGDNAYVLAHETGFTVETVAAVIAAFSPQTRWVDNMNDAANLLHGRPNRLGVMGTNYDRAYRVLNSLDPVDALRWGSKTGKPGGPKMFAFANNILGSNAEVTIDVWAIRAATGLVWRNGDDTDQAAKVINWTGAYDKIANAYRLAAKWLGVAVTAVQATVWIAVRGKAD